MKAKKQEISRPSIFEYHDPLVFLRDWVEHLKSTQPRFSLRALAKQADLATGYLPMALAGKRHLSTRVLDRILPHLGLRKNEAIAFRLLKEIADAETSDARIEALEKIQRLPEYRSANAKEIGVYQYLTRWQYVAIREMALKADFKADPEWIQKRMKGRLGRAEIESAVEFLLENRYLERRPDGTVRATAANLDCKEGVFKISLGEFHRQMLSLAADAIENTPRPRRHILGYTASISPEKMDEVKAILDEALSKIEKISAGEAEKTGSVYHIEMAAFPLTEDPEE